MGKKTENEPEGHKVVDAVGLFCPLPIMRTAEEIKALKPGQTMEVLADDTGFPADIKAWCKSTGNELLSLETKDGMYVAIVRRN